MNIEELKGMFEEFKNKKDTLDNRTGDIATQIKEWCLKEAKRIDKEWDELLQFVKDNIDMLKPGMGWKSWGGDSGEYSWNHFYIRGPYTGGWSSPIKFTPSTIGVDSDYEYHCRVGLAWTKLPKPENVYQYVNPDETRKDADYWVGYKKYLAIRNELLEHTAKKLKDLIATRILEQDNRAKDIMSAAMPSAKFITVEIRI